MKGLVARIYTRKITSDSTGENDKEYEHRKETRIANTSDLVGKYRIQMICNDDRAVTKH